MERHKLRCVQHVLECTGQDVKLYLDSMKELEPSVRACYVEKSELPSHQFVEMIFLDGWFVLEILLRSTSTFNELEYGKNDPIFSAVGEICHIEEDMIILPNQIPLFVLDKLLELRFKIPGHKTSVSVIVDVFFDQLLRLTATEKTATEKKSLHCLDVGRKKLLIGAPIQVENEMYGEYDLLKHCATNLGNAGVKLRKENANKSLLNIQFQNKILYIPPIWIDDSFISLFSNLIAFDRCYLELGQQYITSYVTFMVALIDYAEDVRCLKNHEMISPTEVIDAEAAAMIKSRLHGVVFIIKDDRLSRLSEEINRDCDHRTSRFRCSVLPWRKTLRDKYFSNLWAIISFVAAVLLLIMTAAQTFYAIYGYYKQNN